VSLEIRQPNAWSSITIVVNCRGEDLHEQATALLESMLRDRVAVELERRRHALQHRWDAVAPRREHVAQLNARADELAHQAEEVAAQIAAAREREDVAGVVAVQEELDRLRKQREALSAMQQAALSALAGVEKTWQGVALRCAGDTAEVVR